MYVLIDGCVEYPFYTVSGLKKALQSVAEDRGIEHRMHLKIGAINPFGASVGFMIALVHKRQDDVQV